MTKIQMTKTGLVVALALCAGSALARLHNTRYQTYNDRYGYHGDSKCEKEPYKCHKENTRPGRQYTQDEIYTRNYDKPLQAVYKGPDLLGAGKKGEREVVTGWVKIQYCSGRKGESNGTQGVCPGEETGFDNRTRDDQYYQLKNGNQTFDKSWTCMITGAGVNAEVGMKGKLHSRYTLIPPKVDGKPGSGVAYIAPNYTYKGAPQSFAVSSRKNTDTWQIYGERRQAEIREVPWMCVR